MPDSMLPIRSAASVMQCPSMLHSLRRTLAPHVYLYCVHKRRGVGGKRGSGCEPLHGDLFTAAAAVHVSCWPLAAGRRSGHAHAAHLDEANVLRVLPEALAADVQAVLANDAAAVTAHAAARGGMEWAGRGCEHGAKAAAPAAQACTWRWRRAHAHAAHLHPGLRSTPAAATAILLLQWVERTSAAYDARSGPPGGEHHRGSPSMRTAASAGMMRMRAFHYLTL